MKSISEIVVDELERESEVINLIASEAPLPGFIKNILGTNLHQKYAEGYPGKRYYNGCKLIDEIEQRTQDAITKVFRTRYANVQPHSGTTANQAVWNAACKILLDEGMSSNIPVPTLSMTLNCGGHLSHFSNAAYLDPCCRKYDREFYGVLTNGEFDWAQIESWIKRHEFGIMVVGCSSYPLMIPYAKISEILSKYPDKKFVIAFDISHIAGLICSKNHPHPFEFNWGKNIPIMTSTTHKTWGGPRHAFILWDDDKLTKYINHAVFPEMQGGANFAMVAAVGAWAEWILNNREEYDHKQEAILKNTKKLAEPLKKYLEFGKTDNHIALIRCDSKEHAKAVADKLEESKIIVNTNTLWYGGTGLRISASYESLKGVERPWTQIGEYIKYLIENIKVEKK